MTVSIIPKPNTIKINENTYKLTSKSVVDYPPVAEAGGSLICRLTGLKKGSDAELRFEIGDVSGTEAYRLKISSEGIDITASTPAGFFYAAQTLRQLLPAELENTGTMNAPIELPCLEIDDAPRFSYRSYMLDVSRHFFGIEAIKGLLDMLAMHKINRFHWHLTDDQGFRLEIEKYPLLTELGSKRRESQISGSSPLWKSRYDGIAHEGFYTKDQIRDLVDYARSLFIEVVPEIDIPGHLVAALTAYPQYSCTGGPFEVRTEWGISKDVLCVGKDEAVDFIKNILAEVTELFPYKHLHIGGDECPTKRWNSCPDCQKRMKDHGLKKAGELQIWFTNEILSFLKKLGVQTIVWDEALAGGIDTEIIGQMWHPAQGEKRGRAALSRGHRMIISPFRRYYLDYSFDVFPLRSCYDFDPELPRLCEAEKSLILGVESPLWTEWVDSEERLYWQSFPRATAVAEAGWTEQENRSYDDFTNRLTGFMKRLKIIGASGASSECYLYDRRGRMLKLLTSRDSVAVQEYSKGRQKN